MRVLIVDDSVLFVSRLARTLSELEGVEIVGQARAVAEALKTIRELKPDVVTLDICMPGGSGIEVLKEVKKNPSAPIVIVLSNYDLSTYRKMCLASGADFFFDKSAEFEKVAQVLRSLVSGALPAGGIRCDLTGSRNADGENPLDVRPGGETQLRQEDAEASEKPKLLMGAPGRGEPIYYICSRCLRGFPLEGTQPPLQSARELWSSFQRHVEQEHPRPAKGPCTESVA